MLGAEKPDSHKQQHENAEQELDNSEGLNHQNEEEEKEQSKDADKGKGKHGDEGKGNDESRGESKDEGKGENKNGVQPPQNARQPRWLAPRVNLPGSNPCRRRWKRARKSLQQRRRRTRPTTRITTPTTIASRSCDECYGGTTPSTSTLHCVMPPARLRTFWKPAA